MVSLTAERAGAEGLRDVWQAIRDQRAAFQPTGAGAALERIAGAEPTEAELEEAERQRGEAWVPLTREGDVWVGGPVQRARPSTGPYLRCDDSDWRLTCGIESWFLPQDEASALEDVTFVFAVDGGGGAVRKESPSLLGPFGLPGWGGLPFLVSPGWRGRIFIFLLLVFMRGVCLGGIKR